MTDAIVLGAGAVGTSTAVRLQQAGWSVALVDRVGVGLETSFGNAGIIQREAVEPYAMPRDLRSLVAIGLGWTNDVHYRLAAMPQHVGPLARYWWYSAPGRHRVISQSYATLISHCLSEHQQLITQADAESLISRKGFRMMARSPAVMESLIDQADRLRQSYGVAVSVLSPADLKAAEPALNSGGDGAVHWHDPWSVDNPGALVQAYEALFKKLGGTVALGDAASLQPDPQGSGWQVETRDGIIRAEHVVLALGPWSVEALRGFGYRYPMIRKRGYHKHYRGGQSLRLPLMDASNGYVMAPMSNGLRITSGAQLTARNAPPDPVQLERAERAARSLLDLGKGVEAQAWMGTRPCMPDMLPVIGPAARHRGMWLNFGHGHQGLTLGPVSARLLVDLMTGQTPYVDPRAYAPSRFKGAA